MWVIRRSIVDLDCSKIQILLETLKILNQPRGEFYVSSEVEHSFPQVGCESQVISLDAGLRTDGIAALDLRDLVVQVLHTSSNQPVQENLCDNEQSRKRTNTRTKEHSNRNDLKLINVDHVTTNTKLSHLRIFEESEAVIKMIVLKGTSPTMRHVSRTQSRAR